MNLKNIKAIVNSGLENWEDMLLDEIAKDERVLIILINILDAERTRNRKLLTATNSELSRALVTILDDNYGVTTGKNKQYIDRIWVAGEIKNHYLKWQEFIKCNFKIEGLP